MKTLRLPLKTKWFDMTDSGEKPEDYRLFNEYWFKRLVFQYKKVFHYLSGMNWDLCDKDLRQTYLDIFIMSKFKTSMIGFNLFDSNTMTLGYPKSTDKSRIREYEHLGIEIRTGNPEWGAIEGKIYFVIKHGKLIK